MDQNEILFSGLTLEKSKVFLGTQDNKTQTPQKFESDGSAEQLKLLVRVAEDLGGSQESRFAACSALAEYYMYQQDFKRSLYYGQMALTLASTHGQKAECHINIMICQQKLRGTGMELEDLSLYDKYVEESMLGIKEGEKTAILGVLDRAEQWHDYGLLAAAAKCWSDHPQNTDAYEREIAEAAYYSYKEKFCAEKIRINMRLSKEIIYAELETDETIQHIVSSRAFMRSVFLEYGRICPVKRKVKGVADILHQKLGVAEICEEPEETKSLRKQIENFSRKYTGKSRSLYSAKPKVLQDYISMATDIIGELQRGNIYLMRALVSDPAVFEDMQDYLLLGAAATLLYIHPENKDGREKISAQKKSALWMETSISLSEQFHDMQPLEYRMKELNMSERYTYQHDWMELAQYVNQMVSRSV